MNVLAYFVVGELLIWLGQTTTLPKKVWSRSSFLTELFECDVCLGTWIFGLLSPIFHVTIVSSGVLLVDYIVTAPIVAILAHIFMIGFGTKFGTTVVE